MSRWGPGICSPYNDATREGRRERERERDAVSLLLSKWDRDGGGRKRGNGEGKKKEKGGSERGEAGEERSRIIASHSRRILHLLLLHRRGSGGIRESAEQMP